MKKCIFVFMTLMIIGIFSIYGQEQRFEAENKIPDFTLANGTGDVITYIEIRPSKKKYPNDKNVCALQNIILNDQQSMPFFLPEQMKGLDSFDIVLQYGKKIAKTKISISVERTNKIPLFIMNIKGKNSTIPLVSGAAGGGATAIGIGTGLGISVAAYGAGGFTYYMALIGSIVGGGMVAGATVIATVPLLVGGGVFALIYFLSADTLVVTNIDYALP